MQQSEAVQVLLTKSKLISKKGNVTMKTTKRILALAIVAMMLVAIAIIPASAAETRAPACDCGGTYLLTRTRLIKDWAYNNTQRSCIHFIYGADRQYSRVVDKTYTCEDCGDTYTSRVTEKKWVCEGHG